MVFKPESGDGGSSNILMKMSTLISWNTFTFDMSMGTPRPRYEEVMRLNQNPDERLHEIKLDALTLGRDNSHKSCERPSLSFLTTTMT